MKRLIFLFAVLSMVLLCACSVSDSSVPLDFPDDPDVVSAEPEATDQTDLENPKVSKDLKPATTQKPTLSDSSEIAAEETSPSNPEDIHPSEPTGSDSGMTASPSADKQSTPEPTPKDTSTSSQSQQETPKETSTEPPATESPVEINPPVVDQTLTDPKAGTEDASAVASLVLQYLNNYRSEQGSSTAVRLPGLTTYAEYRSRQLVSNFAHDTDDQRAAAAALQYGEYVDPADFGREGEPYYRANAREAIAKAGYIGTVDEVAKSLARLIRESFGHWTYIGSSEYGYMAVGVTYQSGMWYCDVAVASENTDEYGGTASHGSPIA